MADLIDVGFSVDTRDLDAGTKKLDEFGRTGEGAESSIKNLIDAINGLSADIRSANFGTNKVQELGEASSIAESSMQALGASIDATKKDAIELGSSINATETSVQDLTSATTALSNANKKNSQTTKMLENNYEKLWREHDNLLAKYDAEFAAEQQLIQSKRELNSLLKAGSISQAKYTAIVTNMEMQAKKAAGAFRVQKGAMQQLGYQVGDFAVQVQSGQSAMVAFAQQGSQIAGVLGPWGAVAGAALAIGSALYTAFAVMDDGTETTEDLIGKIKDLTNEFENATIAQKEFIKISLGEDIAEKKKQIEAVEDALISLRAELTREKTPSLLGFGVDEDEITRINNEITKQEAMFDTLGMELSNITVRYDDATRGIFDNGKAAKEARNDLEQMILALEEQARAITETTAQTDARKASTLGATEAELARIEVAHKAIQAEKDRQEAENAAQKAAEDAAKAQQKRNIEQGKSILNVEQQIRLLKIQTDEIKKGAAFEEARLKAERALLKERLMAKGVDEDRIDTLFQMQDAMADMAQSTKDAQKATDDWAGALKSGLGSIDSMSKNGIKGIDALTAAVDVSSKASAVNAVLTQGQGDPYTAFARMAAMAAAVASLGYAVGNIGGSITSSAEKRQARQGTGSVLGDTKAKTESIANAVEITANATSQLVGINMDMLSALQVMQMGITGATTRIVQGAEFGRVNTGRTNAFEGVSGNIAAASISPSQFMSDQITGLLFNKTVFGAVGDILGGDKKITDQGIQILGGALGDVLADTVVRTYQDIKSKDYVWSEVEKKTKFGEVGEDATNQISLVLGSIADAVFAGATSLGMSGDEVKKTIDAFDLAMLQISTKGLTGEEAQAELEAVFGQFFDDLSTEVVPYLDELQQVGEGAGETLARVATEAAVVTDAIDRLGFTLESIGTQEGVMAADALAQLVGGADALASSSLSFAENFVPEAERAAKLGEDLNSALEAQGLTLPETRSGYLALIQAQDASTESGRENIATILRLQDYADQYYDNQEKSAEELAAAAERAANNLQATTDDAFNALVDSVNAEKSALNEAHNENLARIQEETKARLEANNLALDAAKEGLGAIKKEMSSISKAVDMLSGAFEPVATMQRSQAIQTITNALATGNFAGAGQAATRAAQISPEQFASAEAFRREQGRTLALLGNLESEGGQQLSTAEETVLKLQAQTDVIKLNSEIQLGAAKKQHDEQIDSLDSIIETAESQLNTLRGIFTGILSIPEALRSIEAAIIAEAGTRVEAAVEQNPMASVIEQIAPVIDAASMEALSAPVPEAVTNTITKPSDAELVTEVRKLREDQSGWGYTMAKNTNKLFKIWDKFDGDGLPSDRGY